MKPLAILLMVVGALWALLGMGNIIGVMGQTPGAAAVGIMVNGALFVFPGLVVLGIGALIYRRVDAPAPAARGGFHPLPPGLVPCRTCQRAIAPDAPTCPQCGAPEPVAAPQRSPQPPLILGPR